MSLLNVLPLPDGLTPEDVRFCRACNTYRPLTEFRLRHRGGTARFHQCNTCHLAANREWRVARRNQHQRQQFGKSLTLLATQPDQERMSLAFRSMLTRLGGLEGFVAAWRETYDHAPRGSFTAFRCLRPIMTLMMSANNQPTSEASFDPAVMTDEQLEEALEDRVTGMIAANPEIAIVAASKLGWTVIPPDDELDNEAELDA